MLLGPVSSRRRLSVHRFTAPKPLGLRGEHAAARCLAHHGYTLLAGGQRNRYGEIDLIAVDYHGAGWYDRIRNRHLRRTVVFVEVKTRRNERAGSPASAVDGPKQHRIADAALAYLKANHLLEYPARFDVMAVTWPAGAPRPSAIEHYKNAFEPPGRWQFYS